MVGNDSRLGPISWYTAGRTTSRRGGRAAGGGRRAGGPGGLPKQRTALGIAETNKKVLDGMLDGMLDGNN